MKIMENLKEHPYLSAFGVFVLGLILILIFFGGSKTTTAQNATVTSGPDPSVVAANTQLSMAQIAANVQVAGINSDLSKTQDSNATALAISQLQASTQNNYNNLQADLAKTLGLDQNQTQIAISTLAANVQQSALQTQEFMAKTSADTSVQLASLQNQQVNTIIAGAAQMQRDNNDALTRIVDSNNQADIQKTVTYVGGQTQADFIMSHMFDVAHGR